MKSCPFSSGQCLQTQKEMLRRLGLVCPVGSKEFPAAASEFGCGVGSDPSTEQGACELHARIGVRMSCNEPGAMLQLMR